MLMGVYVYVVGVGYMIRQKDLFKTEPDRDGVQLVNSGDGARGAFIKRCRRAVIFYCIFYDFVFSFHFSGDSQ